MNIKKIKQAIENLREDLDGALIATDVYPTGVGTSIAGYNEQPAATALFDRVTTYLVKSLDNAGFPGLNDYYLLDLKDNHLVVILYFEEGYQQGMLIDTTKVNLGILLNIAIPNVQKALREAFKE